MSDSVPTILVYWEQTVRAVLARTGKFPRHVRFTLSSRIDNLALDVYERLVEASYTRDKSSTLRRVNLDLTKLRLLLRLGRDERHLDRRGFEHLMRRMEEAGRMVGGWTRQQVRR